MGRLLLLALFLLLLDGYVFQALRTLTQHWSEQRRFALWILYWMIPVLSIGYIFLNATAVTEGWAKTWTTYLQAAIFVLYVSKLLIVPFLLIDDFRRLVHWVWDRTQANPPTDYRRSRFLTQAGVLLGAIPFFSLTYGIIRNPYRYKVFRETVRIPNLPQALEGLRIVQISDIHSGSFTFKEPVSRAIDLINDQQPDLVFFTGDLVNDRADEMLPFVDLFSRIKARYGVFSVLGNHDYGDYHYWPSPEAKAQNFQQLLALHQQMGWTLLRNEHRRLTISDSEIAIIGVENFSAHPRFPRHGDLAKAYRGTEKIPLKILLSHDPSHWTYEVTKDFQDIDLTLSGHTHGMQFGVEIPGVFKWSPIKYMYQQWAGLYRASQQHLYVNRGLGFLGYPGRVGILPEITCLDLTRDKA